MRSEDFWLTPRRPALFLGQLARCMICGEEVARAPLVSTTGSAAPYSLPAVLILGSVWGRPCGRKGPWDGQ